MSELVTIAIIIGVAYQLAVAILKKKDPRQNSGKPAGSARSPNEGSRRELSPGTSRETLLEQLKHILENGAGSYPTARPIPETRPVAAARQESPLDYYVPTESAQGVEGRPGIEGIPGMEGTGDYVGILGPEGYKSAPRTAGVQSGGDSAGLGGVYLALTEKDLIGGVMWAEILGKPRAKRPFRGPRT